MRVIKCVPGLVIVVSLFLFSSCKKDVIPDPVSESRSQPAGNFDTGKFHAAAFSTVTTSAYKFSAPIVLKNQSNLTISGDSINGGSGPCISLTNCHNIHITHCRLQNGTTINSTGVNIATCTGITVDNCLISKVATGVYAERSQTINVNNNQFLNMMGPYPRGAYVQFNNVSGSGNRIQDNKGENIAGQSNPEDGISLYKCNGLPNDPILVTGNMLRGGGPSTTGAGITVGNQGGSYQTVTNNIVVNTGTDGMQVAGGTYINMSNNTIYGTATSISHVGLGFGNYSGLPCNNITMGGNKIKWMCGRASDLAYYPKGTTVVEKDESYQTTLAKPAGWSTNILGAPITAGVLPTTLIETVGSLNTAGSGTTKATGSNVNTAPATTTTIPATTTGSKSATTPSGSTTATSPATTTVPPTTTKALSAYKFSAPIVLKNQSNLTISGDSINGGSGPCISLTNCHNIHITHCRLQNGTTVNSTGVNIATCTGITVDNCLISKVATGVYAERSQTINVNNNQFLNMMGPYPRGAYVQFNNVSGSGNRIQDNKGENIAGQSNPEDGINLYKCNGLPNDPILVTGNMLRGGGPSTTGAGITVGDQGGSYQTVTNNIVVNTGTGGMQVAGGTYINMSDNTIYSIATSISHVGLGYGNYSGLPSNNITMGGNKIKWMCGRASDLAYYPKGTTVVEKDESYQTTLAKPAGWSTNILGAPITASILPATLIKL